ncbi:MAG TPA: hypothetical protein VF941_06550, partial [Clostridia bacterium]
MFISFYKEKVGIFFRKVKFFTLLPFDRYPLLREKKVILAAIIILASPIIVGISLIKTNYQQHAASDTFSKIQKAHSGVPTTNIDSLTIEAFKYHIFPGSDSNVAIEAHIQISGTIPQSIISSAGILPNVTYGVQCFGASPKQGPFMFLGQEPTYDGFRGSNFTINSSIFSTFPYDYKWNIPYVNFISGMEELNVNKLQCVITIDNADLGTTTLVQTFPQTFDFRKDFSYSNSSGGGQTGGGLPTSGACPNPLTDARTYSTKNSDGVTRCYSSTGLGFNTVEGTYSCGPVTCPGDTPNHYPQGSTCVYIGGKGDPNGNEGKCIAGYGDNGFMAPNCKYNPADNGKALLQCPSPIDFYVQVASPFPHVPISQTVAISINDNGRKQTVYAAPDKEGEISFKTYSGDNIVLTPSTTTSQNTIFNPSVIHSQANTAWSCGTRTNPCAFIADEQQTLVTPTSTPSISPTEG